jgi:hypothetical protein
MPVQEISRRLLLTGAAVHTATLYGVEEHPGRAVLAAARMILEAAPGSIEHATCRAHLIAVIHHLEAANKDLEKLIIRGEPAVKATAQALIVQSQITAADALFGLGAVGQVCQTLATARRRAMDIEDTARRDDLLHTALRIEGKVHTYGPPHGSVPTALSECDPTQARTPAQVAVTFQAARIGARDWSPARLRTHVGYALEAADKLPAAGPAGVYIDRFSFTNALYHAQVAWATAGVVSLVEQYYPEIIRGMAGHYAGIAVIEYTMARMYFRLGRLAEGVDHVRRGQDVDPDHRASNRARTAARNAAFPYRADPYLRDFFPHQPTRSGTEPSSSAREAAGATVPAL